MSKSAGNFYTLRDLIGKGWTGRELRYALITVNYRLPLNFTLDEGLPGARAALGRIDEWTRRLSEKATAAPGVLPAGLAALAEGFFTALDDDLNISGAMGQLFDLIRDSNRAMDAGTLDAAAAAALNAAWLRINSVLRFEAEEVAVPAEVLALLEERKAVRAAKDFTASDRLRDAISALGWVVKDSKEGQKLSPK